MCFGSVLQYNSTIREHTFSFHCLCKLLIMQWISLHSRILSNTYKQHFISLANHLKTDRCYLGGLKQSMNIKSSAMGESWAYTLIDIVKRSWKVKYVTLLPNEDYLRHCACTENSEYYFPLLIYFVVFICTCYKPLSVITRFIVVLSILEVESISRNYDDPKIKIKFNYFLSCF